jgi:hypothetical protein
MRSVESRNEIDRVAVSGNCTGKWEIVHIMPQMAEFGGFYAELCLNRGIMPIGAGGVHYAGKLC